MAFRPFHRVALLGVCAASACVGTAFYAQQKRDGYKNTPIIPEQQWHVHDSDRPYPKAVVPGATLGEAPSDATILFDGKDLSKWMQGGNDPKFKPEDGTFQIAARTGDLTTRDTFGDCQLHVEWQESPQISGTGQGRGNSGIYLMDLFEIQVLDSYKSATYADGQAGALYGQWPPLVNPVRKPGEWQSYDIIFEAPKFEGDKLVSPAYVTLFINGVLAHNHRKLNGPSAHQAVLPYTPIPPKGHIHLQDHGDAHPPKYRNIWIRDLAGYDQPEK